MRTDTEFSWVAALHGTKDAGNLLAGGGGIRQRLGLLIGEHEKGLNYGA